MISLPNFLKRFQKEARRLIGMNHIKDIEFSGVTYQVLVQDPHIEHELWVFLQLDKQGRLKDSFCSCPDSEKFQGCLHQAAAFLAIYGPYSLPLHRRFERSFWNHLCKQCSALVGQSSIERRGHGKYSCQASEGQEIFSIEGKIAEAIDRLEKIFFHREFETEETSIKFSNLSEEEMTLWNRGKPSPRLLYELSFWSELAKWLLALQEAKEKYTIAFQQDGKPSIIDVEFPEIEAKWNIPEESLVSIIPSLATVQASLTVHHPLKEKIEKIVYDKQERRFVPIARQKERLNQRIKGKALGDWIYVKDDGFYPKERAASLDVGEWNDVEKILNEHAEAIQELLSERIVETPIAVSYQIFFDDQWNLVIEEFLFQPGDLSSPESQRFGEWVYLEDRGFYRVDFGEFQIKTIVSSNDIPEFVHRHRGWFNAQQGFQTHLNPLEAALSYRVDEGGNLTFLRHFTDSEMDLKTKDFGRWVFVKGVGFFPKEGTQPNFPIKAGMKIPQEHVSAFIRTNQHELQFVKDFFSLTSPVAKSGLNILLNSDRRIEVSSHYESSEEYRDKNVHFFEEYSYVEGEGFHEIPAASRLPERFRHTVIIDEDQTTFFLNQEIESLKPYIHFIDTHIHRPKRSQLVTQQIDRADGPGQEYLLKLGYQTELGTLSLTSLWQALHRGERYVFSEAGLFDLEDKRFSWLRALRKGQIQKRNNMVRLSSLELLRLNAFEEISISDKGPDNHSWKLLEELTEFKIPEDPDLKGLKSHLRPYQDLGVKWLWFLYHYGLSGLLCDDMGLGKTHQAMALLMAVVNHWRKQEGSVKKHFLIICPTSVIYHWQEKLAEFLPELAVGTFYGAKRSLEGFYSECDILLTSYGVWRNEAEILRKMPFEVAVFDELQIAKNQTSRIYQSLLKAQAKMRIGLTGTPIENRLRELKTLFDIVLPTYMPGELDYRELFIQPIEKGGDADRKQLLKRMIKPFVLRRKKEDVLFDLPEKIEEIAHCGLLPEQRNLYIEVLKNSRDRIIDELEDDKTPIPYIHIFALLSHLKQVCNHPASYLKKPLEYKQYQSGKWNLFVELLDEARESGQKVVVFSQYLAMLDIIEEYLKEHHIGYASIRGSTLNRGEQLQRFNTDPHCEVFVASLQAAGLGIDLTAASVVIHYDRWWNAARENQATDRVHRIGQTRGVQVFKLMTKETLEEHIDFLISRKHQLLNDVVAIDDHQVIKQFDRQEIIGLLQTLPVERVSSLL